MDHEALVARAKEIAADRITDDMGVMEKVDVLEMAMMELLDIQIMTPALGRVGIACRWRLCRRARPLADGGRTAPAADALGARSDGFLPSPVSCSTGAAAAISAKRETGPDRTGLSDNIVLACLLHDISVIALIRTDHGHWSAQLVEPYVPEETAWAIRHHQALSFLPDPEVGYEYPKSYMTFFGEDYDPPDYIKREWDYCRNHRWYMSARLVTLNDLYAFDPDAVVELEEFEDVIGRTFEQPSQTASASTAAPSPTCGAR